MVDNLFVMLKCALQVLSMNYVFRIRKIEEFYKQKERKFSNIISVYLMTIIIIILHNNNIINNDNNNNSNKTRNLCADQLETSTSLPTPPGKAQAFELLKIGLFKFLPPQAKIVFKCPTLSSNMSVRCHCLLLSSLMKFVNKHANTCLVHKNTALILQP